MATARLLRKGRAHHYSNAKLYCVEATPVVERGLPHGHTQGPPMRKNPGLRHSNARLHCGETPLIAHGGIHSHIKGGIRQLHASCAKWDAHPYSTATLYCVETPPMAQGGIHSHSKALNGPCTPPAQYCTATRAQECKEALCLRPAHRAERHSLTPERTDMADARLLRRGS